LAIVPQSSPPLYPESGNVFQLLAYLNGGDAMTESYLEHAQEVARKYARRLREKPYATEAEIAQYRRINYRRGEIIVNGKIFRLDREDDADNLDAVEPGAGAANLGGRIPFWDMAANQPEGFGTLPAAVDHRNNQTPIKDQRDRNTCVCFASLAALESLIKVQENRDIDLSEQYANWVFMAAQNKNQCDDGLRATMAARYLSVRGVCEEAEFPYQDRASVLANCTEQPPLEARENARFGIGALTIINGLGINGPSIGNTDFLEAILSQGHDIVFGMKVAWGQHDENFVFDVIQSGFGNPLQSAGGHAMLIVGYERNAPIPFFIMKNSWGTNVNGEMVGKDGYYFLSYDYVRNYGKYGFVVRNVRSDMPTD
jgi:hypothetical protein